MTAPSAAALAATVREHIDTPFNATRAEALAALDALLARCQDAERDVAARSDSR